MRPGLQPRTTGRVSAPLAQKGWTFLQLLASGDAIPIDYDDGGGLINEQNHSTEAG